ncbi:MAG TPA: hypothetical protein VF857_01895 [Spirochaetota bacterium]
MKKILIGISVFIGLLIILSLVVSSCEKKKYGPEQSFALINTGTSSVSVTFQAKNPDGTYQKTYLKDVPVKPNETVYEEMHKNVYLISTWDSNGKLIREIPDVIVSFRDDKDIFEPIWIDAQGKSNFAMVNLNFLYKGNSSLADHLAKSFKTDGSGKILLRVYKGERPFMIDKVFNGRTIVYPGSKIPKEVGWGETVYGFIPFPSDAHGDDLRRELQEGIQSLM